MTPITLTADGRKYTINADSIKIMCRTQNNLATEVLFIDNTTFNFMETPDEISDMIRDRKFDYQETKVL